MADYSAYREPRSNSYSNSFHNRNRSPRPHVTFSSSDDVKIPRQVFEKIYLNPPVDVKGDFRNILANPTPLGLVGFLAAAFPLSLQLMGWAGSAGGGAATIGMLWFFGGLLQLLACIMEWVLGNTFSFLVFGTFGAAILSFAAPSTPAFNPIAPSNLTPAEQSAHEAAFNASFATVLLVFGLLTTTFLLCALRTNAVFVFCFACISGGMFVFAASYWQLAAGHTARAEQMQKAVGAIVFVCCIAGWYLLVANLLESLEFGFSLPVGDLSERFRGLGRAREYRDRSSSV